MRQYNKGVYPTMITPYTKNGEIDYEGAEHIVDWYMEKGCDGIFEHVRFYGMYALSDNGEIPYESRGCADGAGQPMEG